MKWRTVQARVTTAGLVAFIGMTLAVILTSTASASCALEGNEERTVTRVIDGETMVLDGGTEVRLVGALAPQPFDTAGGATEWPIADAARAALDALVTGRPVTLSFSGRRSDRYGRLLAHVFAPAPGEAPAVTTRTWVQGEMLKRGFARAYALDAETQCVAELIAHEQVAREGSLGLWSEPAYAVRDAAEFIPLTRLAGTYQIVEGRVRAVGDVRGSTYLNFGDDYRQDFTVVIRPAARRVLATGNLKVETLTGAVVRVRGWIERKGGPLIEIAHPGTLEWVAAAQTAPAPSESSGQAPRRRARRVPAQ